MRALQAAQRRLQNLERDLRPLADRMKTLWVQAEQIAEEQPERGQQCRARVQELEAMHAELLAQARTWIEEAERSQGQQMFEQVMMNCNRFGFFYEKLYVSINRF